MNKPAYPDLETRIPALAALVSQGAVSRDMCTNDVPDDVVCRDLLSAISPEIDTDQPESSWPEAVMPRWFARVTSDINDCGSDANWPKVLAEYTRLLRASSTWDESRWRRLRAAWCLADLDDVIQRATDPTVETVAALWRRVLDGDEPGQAEWDAAATASVTAYREAERQERCIGEPALWSLLTGAFLATTGHDDDSEIRAYVIERAELAWSYNALEDVDFATNMWDGVISNFLLGWGELVWDCTAHHHIDHLSELVQSGQETNK